MINRHLEHHINRNFRVSNQIWAYIFGSGLGQKSLLHYNSAKVHIVILKFQLYLMKDVLALIVIVRLFLQLFTFDFKRTFIQKMTLKKKLQ